MILAPLAKRLYPKLPSGRAVYQLKVILLSVSVGVSLGAILLTAFIISQGHIGK